MMCYRDMTFCQRDDCALFGKSCERSLTQDVVDQADIWWKDIGKGGAPIAQWGSGYTPPCFESRQKLGKRRSK